MERPARPPRHGQATVLIVDDEPDIRGSLAALLEAEAGTHVISVDNGAAALEVLRRQPVHLILTDYRMPGLDGLEFLAQAAKVRPGIASIILTAYPDPDVAARAVRDYGAKLLVAKPLDLDYLVSFVRSIIERATHGMRAAAGASR